MKVKAITKTHCPKCEWAKEKLKDYPIQWLNFDRDEEARDLSRKYYLNVVPVFLMFQDGKNVVIMRSVLSVRKSFEQDRNL